MNGDKYVIDCPYCGRVEGYFPPLEEEEHDERHVLPVFLEVFPYQVPGGDDEHPLEYAEGQVMIRMDYLCEEIQPKQRISCVNDGSFRRCEPRFPDNVRQGSDNRS